MLQTKYITPNEFQEYFGIDLCAALKTETNAIAFIKRIEDRLATFVDANFNRNIDKLYPEFSDYQKEHYKLALLEQCIYVFKNSDLSVDSGYDPDKGEIEDINKLRGRVIAPNCKENLILCGIWNRAVKPPRNIYGPGWWFR